MYSDRYGNLLSTRSEAARDAYVEGVDRFLAAMPGAEDCFRNALKADASFVLARAAMARHLQVLGRVKDAREVISLVGPRMADISQRELGHISILEALVHGRNTEAYSAIQEHVKQYPRDVMTVQPCCGVFSLIGFSGRVGREAEHLAFLSMLSPHYENDWWFSSQLAFAQCETGLLAPAMDNIEASFDAFPRSAHTVHIRAHIHYECGEHTVGRQAVTDWLQDCPRASLMHCHLNWHAALWALNEGDTESAWAIVESNVMPQSTWGPPINVLTDGAAFLLRAELAGQSRRQEYWQQLSDYALNEFPKPAISFADAHAALAHALAGEKERLEALCHCRNGFAADLVADLALVFRAYADEDWSTVIDILTPVMATHERLGGSRAQRDLLEFVFAIALSCSGSLQEAQRMLEVRRPFQNAMALVG